jgi:hypothetical protein
LSGHQTFDLSSHAKDEAIPMTPAAPLKPGNCELRITVRQGDQARRSSIKYSVGGTAAGGAKS